MAETEETVAAAKVARVRPSRLSMEGYIYNANKVLETALNPKTWEVPVELVEKCKGVVVITMVQVGVIVSLQYGTGIIMKKTETGWSAPSAVAIGGTSFGAVLGGKRDNIIIFIMDDKNMEDFVDRPQSRISLDAAFAAGPKGAKLNLGREAEEKGTISITFSNGAYAGMGVEMFTMETAHEQNEIFYEKKVKAKDILFKENAVEIPPDTQIPDIYVKMEKLANGETWIPSDDDIQRSRHFADQSIRKSERLSNKKEGAATES